MIRNRSKIESLPCPAISFWIILSVLLQNSFAFEFSSDDNIKNKNLSLSSLLQKAKNLVKGKSSPFKNQKEINEKSEKDSPSKKRSKIPGPDLYLDTKLENIQLTRQIEALKHENNKAEKRMKDLEAENAAARIEKSDALKQLEESKVRISELEAESKKLEWNLAKNNELIFDLAKVKADFEQSKKLERVARKT